MTAPHRLAVILPVFNGARFIEEAIASVLAQTFSDFELIVIDDGSTDETSEVLARFSDPRITITRFVQNRGLVSALNHGIHASRSELVARMDADDICFPRRFERQVDFLDTHPSVGMCGTWTRQFGDATGTLHPPVEPTRIRARLFFGWAMDHPSVMMRRSMLEKHQLAYDPAYPHIEDFDFFIRAAEVFDLANIPEVLLRTRAHPGEVSVVHRNAQVATEGALFIRQLRALDPDVSEAEAEFHVRLCTGMLAESELLDAERWLMRLSARNDRTLRYDRDAFTEELRRKWYRLAYQTVAARPGAVLNYLRSPLLNRDRTLDHVRLLLRLAFTRALAVRRLLLRFIGAR